MSKPSLVIVLAEDQRHQRFVRHYLRSRGVRNHEIRLEPLPAGRGAGEQFVRDRYPNQVLAFRRRPGGNKAATALLIVIDADTGPVLRRLEQLQASLLQRGVEDRSPNEPIAILVPRRHIETWILALTGSTVDEDSDFHSHPSIDVNISEAAVEFSNASRPAAPPLDLDSLRRAVNEARDRLPW